MNRVIAGQEHGTRRPADGLCPGILEDDTFGSQAVDIGRITWDTLLHVVDTELFEACIIGENNDDIGLICLGVTELWQCRQYQQKDYDYASHVYRPWDTLKLHVLPTLTPSGVLLSMRQ